MLWTLGVLRGGQRFRLLGRVPLGNLHSFASLRYASELQFFRKLSRSLDCSIARGGA